MAAASFSIGNRAVCRVGLFVTSHFKTRSVTSDSGSDLPKTTKRWQISRYGSISDLEFCNDAHVPQNLKNDQVLVKVMAASINPFDIEMIEGYGSTALNILRKMYNIHEFPLVTGRDFSGVVLKKGRNVRRFRVGDEIWGARWVIGDGTHSEYCICTQSEVSLKPRTLQHIGAASLPYIACTSWAALVTRAGLDPENVNNNKNVLILGGSGGIGSFSIQLSKAFGNRVSATCSEHNFELVKSIGADAVINYKDPDYKDQIEQNGPYDIILDARRGDQSEKIGGDPKSVYVTLMPPFLPSIDENGLMLGLAKSGKEFCSQSFKDFLENKGRYSWGLFFPNGGILNKVASLIDKGLIKPVISSVHDFDNAKEAFEKLKDGTANGKIVLDLTK
eukprot:Seg1759.1 transcript_id=Seg1759.1/GoldUCD/mRNA.D3Y31 product="Reticulon-4-interacting protein 1 mitochondrial" protein_id=Seg1759.1/GoldUCD/D3Y31